MDMCLVQSDIASTGMADSFIIVSHVIKSLHAHQLTAHVFTNCCSKHMISTNVTLQLKQMSYPLEIGV